MNSSVASASRRLECELSCDLTPVVGYSGRMIRVAAVAGGIACVLATTVSGSPGDVAPSLLSWPPPHLADPTVITVPETNGRIVMDAAKDYVVRLGHLRACGGLSLEGGRNVVVVGGRVTIPGPCGSSFDRTAIKVRTSHGTVHLEGILIDGPFTHDGIVTLAPQATLQIENVRIESLRARDTAHPDCLQTQAGLARLRIDRFTCSTELQGVFLKVESGNRVGPVDIRNTDITGTPGKHLFFQTTPDIPVKLSNVWLHTDRPWAPFGFHVYPQADGRTYLGSYDRSRRAIVSRDGRRLWFIGSNITGVISKGRPPTGDMVPAGFAGTSYVSPGYVPRAGVSR